MGGGVTYLENILRELSKTQSFFHFFVLISKNNNLSSFPKIEFIEIEPLKSSLGKVIFNQFTLRKILKKYRIDIVFQMANYATFFCPVKQIILLRQSHFFSKIFSENIYPLLSIKERIDLILRRSLFILSVKSADVILSPSQVMIDDIRNFVFLPESKTYVNHYGVYLDNFSKDIKPKQEKINILYTAYYWYHRNFITLLKAVEILDKTLNRDFSVTLTLSPEDPINQKCATFKRDSPFFSKPTIKKHINPVGKLPNSKIPNLYKTADIFVWPTITEAFGHPLVEAMASTLPIIASDIPINREICGEAALYFNTFDAQDLADKVKLLIENPEFAKTLSEKSFQRSKIFKWEDHIKRLLEIFDTI